MAEDDAVEIEVAYARPERHELIKLSLPRGATLRQALEASGLLQKYPEIDVDNGKFGIFSRLSRMDTVLRTRDRVEIYRPLLADPKEVRRRRAAEGKATKKGGPA